MKSSRKLFGSVTFILVLSVVAGAMPAANADASADYNYAGGLYDRKLYGLAAQSLRDFVKNHATDPHAKIAAYQLAAALYRSPGADGNIDYKAAAQAYEDAMHRYPDATLTVQARFELADCYFNLKQYDKALDQYTQFLKGSPPAAQAAQANYWRAEALAALKRPQEAGDAYRKVLKDYPSSDIAPYAQYGIGLMESDAGHYEAAAAAFKAVLANYPASDVAPESRLRLADAQLLLKQWSAAGTTYNAVLQDSKSAKWRGAAAQGVADAAFGAADWPGAIAAYKTALAAAPAGDDGNGQRSYLQLRLADSYYNAKQWQPAVDAYDAVIKSADPKTMPAALYYSAGALMALKRPSDAVPRYRKLLFDFIHDPLASKATLRLGDALQDSHDNKGAADAYRTVLTGWPGSAEAKEAQASLINMVAVIGSSPNTSASSDLGAILRDLPAGPASSDARLKLAQAAYAGGDYDKAATLAQAALNAKPDAATAESALYIIASARLNTKQPVPAAAAFRKQLAAYPAGRLNAQGRLGLAWAQLDAKNWAGAKATAAAALGNAKATAVMNRAVGIQLNLAEADGARFGGDPAGAARIYAVVAENTQTEVEFHAQAVFGLAMANEGREQWVAAAAAWGQYASTPTDPTEKARGYLRQAMALSQAKNDGAVRAFDRSIAAQPKGEFAAAALSDSAWAEHDTGHVAEAAARWKQLANDYPGTPYAAEALFELGEGAFAAKDWDVAAGLYTEVTEKYPASQNAAAAWYQLGSALYNGAKWGDAAVAFDGAAKAAKNEIGAEALFWAGESYRRAGQSENAKARYTAFVGAATTKGSGNAAAKIKELLPAARLGLGQMLAGGGDYAGAVTAYQLALPDAGGAVAAETEFRLGEALVKLGRAGDAAPHFLKVTIGYPNSEWAPRAQWDAAQALEQGGDKIGAIELYRSLAARVPADDLTAQAAARLKALSGT